VYLDTGKQLRVTAVDLIEKVIEMSDPKCGEGAKRRVNGYLFSSWMLQALAAEYLLKSLSIRDAARFRKTHDLVQLFKTLNADTQAEIAGQGMQESIAVPEFLEQYRSAFVDWRYPFQEMRAIPSPVEFDNVLAVLVGFCEPGSPQARRMLEKYSA